MTNLIVAVVSIGFVSILALSTTWYGGSAYLSQSPKAQAVIILEQAKQIAAAWRAWSVNNKGQAFITDYNVTTSSGGGTSNDLTPTYLATWPTSPIVSSITVLAGFRPILWENLTTSSTGVSASARVNALVLEVAYSEINLAICNNLIKQAYNVSIIQKSSVTPWRTPVDCVYQDNNSNNVIDTGDVFDIAYKVF